MLANLRAGLIGDDVPVPGPFGTHPMVYADYTASGRALRQIEDFVMTRLLPWYANSHTEASFCGAYVTRMRRAARAEIARICGATADHAVIFAGSGATAGLNRLVGLFGIDAAVRAGQRPLVLIGPYEHHSNILPWRESGAEVIEVGEAATGGPDLAEIERQLIAAQGRPVVGSFSAASNVTGILTDVDAVSRLLNRHGARVVWDYAGGGPYLPIDMAAGGPAQKDAVVVSPHKFIGGPGASGVLILRRGAVARDRPVWPGGGTVRFVSPTGQDYSGDLVAREEAGTPNVVGDIRAALAFLAKEAMGQDRIAARLEDLRQRALAIWSKNPAIRLLGDPAAPALPIFSMQIGDPATGRPVQHQMFTRMLSDIHGIQARGGCACAGPYAHRLLALDAEASDEIRARILAGDEAAKPGWTRLNLSVLLTDAKADRLIAAVDALARHPHPPQGRYEMDPATARFRHIA
ncbi:aminotransferase class V-fold PLP-dependent enzyme [Frigidibacter oleivorans]|uniref:aminotransferase class V-fold PLP-dependent enzyme n=1 Tax=Frigidibacter oleivorans TaxID=2487129 RepID=UPI001F2316F1|nr:aminotransferase class V-fold PLP-dependent enzyme [Frigidibacter oleivorans]